MRKLLLFFLPFLCCFQLSIAQNTQFVFEYDAAAQNNPALINAVEFAFDIWSNEIESSIPIKVQVNYVNLGFFTAGNAQTESFQFGFQGAPDPNIKYPVALANQFAQTDLNGSAPEIIVNLNSSTTFYFGTDANPPSNQFDLVSVVLHEACHALGFFSEAKVNAAGEGEFAGFLPYIYDTFLVDANGNRLLDIPENTIELGNALTSGQVFMDGENAKAALGGNRPQISANNYTEGSSISHWNLTTYLGTDNSLMTSATFNGSAQHTVGDITRGQMADIGWTLSSGNGGSTDFTDAFITTWQTSIPGESITIPTFSSEVYNYSVDWGDGTIEEGVIGNATHTYTSSGTHTVSITGVFPMIHFNRNGDLTKIRTIEQWGNIEWNSMARAFYGCVNLEVLATDSPNLTNVTTMSNMFDGCNNLQGNSSFQNWDVSNVTIMRNLFAGTNFNQNIASWDVRNVEDMASMFFAARAFNQPISNWTTSSVRIFTEMFRNATAFNQQINNWDMSSAEVLSEMFQGASSFNQPIGQWNVSNVVRLSRMFEEASSFNQPLGNWNVSKVVNMRAMFKGASSFNQNLGSWDISGLSSSAYFDPILGDQPDETSAIDMFIDSGLSTQNYDALLNGWGTLETDNGETQINYGITLNVDGVEYCVSDEARNLLKNTYGWNIIDGGKDPACISEDFTNAFITTWQTTTSNESITIPTTGSGYNYTIDWGDGTIEQKENGDAVHVYATQGIHTIKIVGVFPQLYIREYADKDKIRTVEQWGNIQWASMNSAFQGASNLQVVATDVPDLSNVYSMDGMFLRCTNFIGNTSFENWDVSNIGDMRNLFAETQFNQNIGAWDISGIVSFNTIFRQTTLTLENYDALLLGWSTLSPGETRIPTNISFGGDNSPYCDSNEARQNLIDNFGWTINDGGESCPEVEVTLENDGSISIVDTSTDTADDNFTISTDGTNLILSNSSPILISGSGVVAIDDFTVQIPLSGITNGLTLEGGTGNNTLNLDTSLSLLGANNGLTLNNLNVQLSGTGNLKLNALNVSNGDFDTNGLTTIVATEANFFGAATLSGTGTINGIVNMNAGSNLAPGVSPGILNIGDLVLDNSNNNFEVDGPTPGTEHDQIVVTGTVTIAVGTNLNLLNGYPNGDTDEIILIENDGTDAITGTFAALAEGDDIAFGNFNGTISYVGGDGNDLVLFGENTVVEPPITENEWLPLGPNDDWPSAGQADFTNIALTGDGTPYVVYRDVSNGNKATVQRYNGSSWEVVGTAGFSAGVVDFTEIALTGDGTPYVVYRDGSNGSKATVQRYNGTSWEVVGTAGFSAGQADDTEIALAGDGTPYVVYRDRSNGNKATVQRYNGTSWEVVGTAGFSAGVAIFTDIAISGDGTPYVVYRDFNNGNKATVQRYNGTSWEVLGTAGFSAGQAYFTDIALAGDGTPYVVYRDASNGLKATVQRYNGTSWEVVGTAGFSTGGADYTDIAISGDGTPYVVYRDNANGNKATVQRYNGTSWEVVGTAGFSAGLAAYTDIALAGDGTPYVVYRDSSNGGKATVQRFNGTSWEVLGTGGFSTGGANYTDIALSSDGTPFVVYQDNSNGLKATVQRYNGSSWEVAGTAGFSAGRVDFTDIALSGDGTPYVVYRDASNGDKTTVQRYNGTSWEVVGTPGFAPGDETFIAISGDDTPYVVYHDVSNGFKTTMQRYNGTSWEVLGMAGFSAGLAVYTDIALAGDGTPYVVYGDYSNGGKATVQRYNGSSWEVVGTAGFSAGGANYTEIALTGDGTPYVVYQDNSNGLKATVQRYNGSSWEVVGTAGFSAGRAAYTDISLTGDGTPYVVYRDRSNGYKATVQRYNGTSWELVGNEGFTNGEANYTSMAIDDQGTITVVYSSGFAYAKTYATAPLDATAPILATTAPEDNAIDIELNTNVTLTFNEPVQWQKTPAPIIIYDLTNNVAFASLEETSTEISLSGNELVIDLEQDFEPNNTYEIRIGALTFEDASGNTFAGIANGDWSFTTVPPVCTLAITEQPQSTAICEEETTLEFAVVATGTGTLSYNWQALGNGLTEWTAIGVQNGNATFALTSPIQSEASGLQYRVVITDDQGTTETDDDCEIISNAAILTVNPKPEPEITGLNSYNEGAIGVVLDAGAGFTTYLWSNGETTQTIQALEGEYTVEVTNENGCIGISEIFEVTKIESDLLITEIMYNPANSDNAWEYIEVYNKSNLPIDLSGYVIDDNTGAVYTEANIVSGIVAPNSSAIIFDGSVRTSEQFQEGWGDVNTIPATTFSTLNNDGDTIGIWDSFESYEGDNETQLNVIEQVVYENNSNGWPDDDGFASIYLTDLGLDNNLGTSWSLSVMGQETPINTTYTFSPFGNNPGLDVGSPGIPVLIDNQAPNVSCPVAITVQNDVGSCSAVFPIVPATANDNVSLPENIEISFVRSDGELLTLTDPFLVGETTVTWTATDEAGNVSESCEQLITVEDGEAPTAVAQDIILELDENGEATLVAKALDNIDIPSSDNCTPMEDLVYNVSRTSFNCSDIGTPVTVFFSVTDASGNESNAVMAEVTVLDGTAPVLTCGGVIIESSLSGQPLVIEVIPPTVLDNCDETPLISGVATLPNTSTFALVSAQSSYEFPVGTTSIVWSAEDSSGNIGTCEQTVTVNFSPSTASSIQSFDITGQEGATVITGTSLEVSMPFGTDLSGLSPTVTVSEFATVNPASGESVDFTAGPVTYTVTAQNGSFTEYTVSVTVLADTTPPHIISLFPEDGATGVSLNTPISITFDEDVVQGTGDGELVTNTNLFGFLLSLDLGTAVINGNVVTFSPGDNALDLDPNTTTTVIIPNGMLKDESDNDFEGITWSFDMVTTGDVDAPLGTVTPANGAVDVPVDQLFQIVFDEEVVDKGSIIALTDANGNQLTTLDNTQYAVDFNGTFSTLSFEISPDIFTLLPETGYRIYVPPFAFEDTSGNDYLGTGVVENQIDPGVNWQFTIGEAPDEENPVAVCQEITVQLDANGMATITAAQVDGGSTDNVGIASLSVSPSSFGKTNIGDNQVMLTVLDTAGNSASCMAIVTVQPAPLVVCPDNLPNENLNIVLPSGTLALGVDSALGVSTDTNGSPCALGVSNEDNGQPWGAYRIAIRLADYNISPGDEMFISVDGKSLTGTARVEINRNNSPNSALGSQTFGTIWSTYETTFTVPGGLTSLDLWFFSNYAQSTPGVALYDNLVVRNLSTTESNLEPVANAGNDIAIVDTDTNGSEPVTLDGGNSVDLDGSIVSYAWSENGSEIGTGISPTIDFDLGVHEITLTVTDNLGATDIDTVRVTVNVPGTEICRDDLVNEDSSIVLRPGTIGAGVDSAVGISRDTNGSSCALEVSNVDSGQPWGSYRIAIRLSDYDIRVGDEMFIGVDGKSLTGTARVEINRNNAPNTALGSQTFGNDWSRYETTFIVPSGVTTLDLWFFSNYAQSSPGVALYDNLTVINLSDTGDNLLPIANAGVDITVEDADANGLESVILNGGNSVDLDGSIVSYVWFENGSEIATGVTPAVDFSLGDHEVTLTIMDDLGAIDTDVVQVTVTDPATVVCSDDLQNEDPSIVLPSGTFALGVDSATGISTDTNGSSCALLVTNVDNGQPWGAYRIAIRLSDYGINEGDELFIGVDGKGVTGTARIEINPNNTPNNSLGSRTFTGLWSTYETTFIVPVGLTTIDLWFFSNYAQQTAGSAVYDNLVVRKLNSDTSGKSIQVLKPSNDLTLYPNPASLETTLSFDQPTTVGTIQVFDVTGRLVRTIKGGVIDSNGTPLNVQEMPTGTYFVKTKDASGLEFQQQMLIQRQ